MGVHLRRRNKKFDGKAVKRTALLNNVFPTYRQKSKIYQPVSRILYQPINRQMVIIYLAATLLLQSCCLPFGIGRAALKRRYMWHYSTQGLPNLSITAKTRELLPHVFNLTPLLSCAARLSL